MFNVIIYEDNIKTQELYIDIITTFFNRKEQVVNFHTFTKYTVNLEKKMAAIPGKKIFIFDIEVPGKSGLDLARLIRNNGDWTSPLILITSYEEFKYTSYTSKFLMLDFISKKENIKTRLTDSLKIAYNVLDVCTSYVFQYNGELFHILYSDILYFEKDFNDNYTFLYTISDSYKIHENILQIAKKFKYNDTFFRTHRSCIVNVDNIVSLDTKTNTIYFKKRCTKLLTDSNKNILKGKLENYQNIY